MDFQHEELKEQAPGGIEVNRIQVPPKRDVRGDNFVRGVQDYDFSIGGRYAWRPSKSYFRVALTIESNASGAMGPPKVQDNIAFSDNPCAGLWDNIYVRAGNADVSSIINYAPQAHQVKTRLGKSRGWLKSIGRSAFGCAVDFNDRVSQVSNNGMSNEEYELPGKQRIGGSTATFTMDALGVVTGTNTFWFSSNLIKIGSTLVIDNAVKYVVTAVTNDLSLQVAGPVAAITVPVAYSDAYFIAPTVNDPASENQSTVYFMYVPPVGIFDHEGLLGSGEYRISMNPNSRFQTAMVETLTALTAGTDYRVTVEDVQFFPCIEKANIAATGIEKLFLTEQHIQSKKLSDGGGGTSTSVLDFTVPPSTTSISVFFADQAAGSSSILPLSRFKISDGEDDTSLSNIQLTYANVNKPSTNWTSQHGNGTNYLTQRYIDTQIDSGMFYSEGGSESFREWRKRGVLLHFDFNRDSNDRSTNVQAQFTFDRMGATGQVMIVAHYGRCVQISSTDGRVTNVTSLSI